jgi:glutamate carboxypeptidase
MLDSLATYLDDRESEIISCLQKLVLIQSGTKNKSGVDRVSQAIAAVLSPLGMKAEQIANETLGNTWIWSTPAAEGTRSILLIGHMDTVFPADTDFNWFREDEHTIHGPGVADMKGGLAVGIFALKALANARMLEAIPLRFIFNPDEEIGSPVSRPIIASEAKRSFAALVLECGSLAEGVVTGRKGKIGFTLTVKGTAGHAAFADNRKKSAILELAHKTIELEALNGRSAGLTVNVGKIQGGIGPNTVPEAASAEVDVRFITAEEKALFESELSRIMAQAYIPAVQSAVLSRSHRSPMTQSEGNKRLFAIVAEQAKRLGFDIKEEFRQGCSDANIVAEEGLPVVDGLGPRGELDHSDREYIVRSSLKERCKLLTLSIHELAGRYRDGSWEQGV